MVASAERPAVRGSARQLLLDAAVRIIRTKGLNATTVDELCAAAGVTKGAFFHHFATKEALAVAAAEHWTETTGALFAASSYHDHLDGTARIFGYLDLRASLITGTPADYTCLAGTMVQEAFETSADVRTACADSIFGHAGTLEADFAEALAASHCGAAVTASTLARFTQTVLQGAFVLSKAANDPAIVIESIDHLRCYFEHLFTPHRD
jgi:TetR/AcrR family transcriptional repressor of nem operon